MALPRQVRMVESLGLMWEEERGRCGGADPPPPPPDPPRTPKPLCRAVDHIRTQFQVSRSSADVAFLHQHELYLLLAVRT